MVYSIKKLLAVVLLCITGFVVPNPIGIVQSIAWTHGEIVDVIIVPGQSNNIALGVAGAAIPSQFATPNPNVFIGAPGGTFSPYVVGTNSAGGSGAQTNWASEAQFAYNWSQVPANANRKLYIMKYAISGIALYAADTFSWAPTNSNPYGTAKTYFATTLWAKFAAAKQTPRIIAVLWMQGETDAEDSTKAAAYSTSLSNWLAAIPADWCHGNCGKVIIGRISNSSIWTFRTNVRSAQGAVNSVATPVINTDAYPLIADNKHYTAAGIVSLGDDMWSAYLGTYVFTP